MTDKLTCPECHAPIAIHPELLDREVRCPGCAAIVHVPAQYQEGDCAEITEAVEEEGGVEGVVTVAPRQRVRECPACGAPVGLGDIRCGACRAHLLRRDEEDYDEDEEEDEDEPAYRPCPRCGARGAERVLWTFWGSFYGTAIFSHVRCPACAYGYNGRTGRSNLIPAIIFVTIPAILILAILGFVGYMIADRMLWL